MNYNISEPVTLIGEGEYNLDDLKEIRVTESYLGLDQDKRECQNKESFYNCTSRLFKKTFIEKCGCLPINLQTEKVQLR